MRLVCAALLLACAVLGVRAFPAAGPVAGACYSTDGQSVETTWLGGSGDFAYPSPSSGEIVQHDDGSFTVIHTTLFIPLTRRVYLPAVQQ